tara:strand:+ start:52 stop:357 length:306 start_codon:yes stop_codon:yes gene_type:complete
MFKETYDSVNEFNSFLKKNKTLFFDTIITSIKENINNDEIILKIADIEIIDEDCVLDVSIDKTDCFQTLGLARDHYIKLEQYEKCIEIDNIENKLKDLFNI